MYSLENVSYFYPDRPAPAVSGVNLSIGEGEFLLVTGPSGGGKSTLARILAGSAPHFYGGRLEGAALFRGEEIRYLEGRRLHREVGMVFQDPEKQIVMTRVESEIAFGCENLGVPPAEIRRRVAETAAFLNLSGFLRCRCEELSSGEKQRVAIGSVLSMAPRVLLLDEPTSQLDPVAAEEVLRAVKRLNDELGFTIVLIEQRLELCFQIAGRVILMEDGRIVRDSTRQNFSLWAARSGSLFIPPVASFFAIAGSRSIPMTVGDGRKLLASYEIKDGRPEGPPPSPGDVLLEARKLQHTYSGGVEALKGVDITLRGGEVVFLLGENGAGKSTLMKTLCCLLRPSKGSVTVLGDDITAMRDGDLARVLGYLSQNPDDYLFNETVREELLFTLNNLGLPDDGRPERLLELLGISSIRDANPRDLSTGERQRVALASVLVTDPAILLLDEPTRGLDGGLKAGLGKILQGLAGRGKGVLVVTQDVEFAAEYARRVILMFNGEIVADGQTRDVLKRGLFYSPQIARLFAGKAENVVTLEDALKAIGHLK